LPVREPIAPAEREKRRIEEALRHSEREYRELVELANCIILRLDRNGKIVYLNPYARQFFGFTQKELLGKSMIGTIVPAVASSGEDLAVLIASLLENPGQHAVQENENQRKDGSRCWVFWTNKAICDRKGCVTGILCIGNDMTDKKTAEMVLRRSRDELESEVKARTAELQQTYDNLLYEVAERKINEEALRESEAKYRSIVEGAMEGIFQTNADGGYTMANMALARMLGYGSPDEFLASAENLEERLYANPERRLEFRRLLEAEGRVRDFETQYCRKDGHRIWVSLSVRALYDDRGSFVFYEGTVEDISMRRVMDGTTRALSSAIEIRDPYTAGHQLRVTEIATEIAREMGYADDHLKAIQIAGMLHDIGKIYVPAEFLSRPGPISTHELDVLRDHSNAGYEILKGIEFSYPIAEIVLQHHERMNGTGYPRGLAGDEIFMEARIIAVADVVESMSSHRPYRPSLGIQQALREIRKNRGSFYDGRVADVCLRLFREKKIHLA
jgi:PAS domain S-box-containing protein/putative nucleotidyltransferase with HDIG domain